MIVHDCQELLDVAARSCRLHRCPQLPVAVLPEVLAEELQEPSRRDCAGATVVVYQVRKVQDEAVQDQVH